MTVSELNQTSLTALAKSVLDIEANSIIKLKERINDNINTAVKTIISSKGRVIVTGMGKSGHIGRKIAATLSSTGTPAYFLHPAESTHGDSGIITRQDVVIALSNSGETKELLNLLPLIKRFEVPLIAFVGKTTSTLANMADIIFDVSVEKEACPLGKAPTASTTAALAMGDALAICLLKQRGFSAEDFLMFHPSGSLGKGVLYTVGNLMIKGDELPVANENIKFLDAIQIITDKKLGCVILTDDGGKMTGVVTDGDIRRILMKHMNIDDLITKDVMTQNPKTVSENALAVKALALMEKHSITSVAVCDQNKKPIGIIHIHNLLKAGVA
ncbi:MAG: KpsF/GutQ family sugar-phosphate isomerase [Candidatus Gastranaerophilales bacterium]|nr:KpsF/GutQ family sugar-phosphate isomerase [Candidatus Gastranaerophilales bacterium]